MRSGCRIIGRGVFGIERGVSLDFEGEDGGSDISRSVCWYGRLQFMVKVEVRIRRVDFSWPCPIEIDLSRLCTYTQYAKPSTLRVFAQILPS